jgi:hypothetical protein
MVKKRYIRVGIILLLISPMITIFSINLQNYIKSPNIVDPKIALTKEAPNLDSSFIPSFDNSSLASLWENPNVEMLIISPNIPNFINSLIPLADWKNSVGVKTIILSNYSSYQGNDDAERIRNMIKDYYEKYHIRWVLLAGDTDVIPVRYVYNPDVIIYKDSEYSTWNDTYKPTDFYYASLEGTWDQDGDGIYGESPVYNANGKDEIDWTPEVYVGRFPASNAIELQIMVNKTLKYESNPYNGTWMNRMLLAGGVSSYYNQYTDTYDEDEARLTQFIWQNYTLGNMLFTHLIKTTGSFTANIPPTPNVQDDLDDSSFTNEVNRGYSTIIIAGHGDPENINNAKPHQITFFTSTDALNTVNYNMPSLFYSDACTTSSYDMGDNSIGERMIKQKDAGAIGFIGGLRVTWYLDNDTNLEKLNRGNAKLFWQQFFEENKYQQGKALYDSKVAYLNSNYFQKGETSINLEYQRKNLLTYDLLGDPEVDIYTNYPINVSNNFIKDVYEGQLVNLTIYDSKDNIVPYARVNLISADGKYFTAYANEQGNAKFRFPSIPHENYNITITGHNLKPTYFNCTTLEDTTVPEMMNLEPNPTKLTVFDDIQFKVEAKDNQSGIESAYILLSSDNFKTYKIYGNTNSILENISNFTININKLDPGNYTYAVLLRDYSNNTKLYFESSYHFNIEVPISMIILIIISIAVVGLVGLTILNHIFKFKTRKNKSSLDNPSENYTI